MHGCKLRPDEGLDSISSLAPGSISSNLLVGGTNTVYAWLIQWLADNLGYDVTSIVALPYDWRLSPDKMESRDGFLTLMRKKIEAAVESNGLPGIMVAHSMGNSVFRYFLEWLRVQMHNEAYARYVQQAEHAIATAAVSSHHRGPFWRGRAIYRNIVGGRENHTAEEDDIFVDFTRAVDSDAAEKSKSNQNKDRVEEEDETTTAGSVRKYPKLWELAKMEGDSQWIDWLGKHVWTYVGLAAPTNRFHANKLKSFLTNNIQQQQTTTHQTPSKFIQALKKEKNNIFHKDEIPSRHMGPIHGLALQLYARDIIGI
ncbi:hypothetical protein ACHAWT_004607 [Skeletonema menzelii]